MNPCATALKIAAPIILFLVAHGNVTASQAGEDKNKEDFLRTEEKYCTVYMAKNFQYKVFTNKEMKVNPGHSDLLFARMNILDGISLSKEQCKNFENGIGDYFSRTSNGKEWYLKSDFIPESKLRPIQVWTTRYVYDMGSGPSHQIPSEEMTDAAILEVHSEGEIEDYTAENQHGQTRLFTSDAYSIIDNGAVYRKLFLSPGREIISVDLSGRYQSGRLGGTDTFPCSDTEPLTCGYANNPKGYMHITQLPEGFEAAVEVKPDKILIKQRLTDRWGLKLGLNSWNDYKLFAEFSDPVRPLVYAPGVLFKPTAKPSSRRRYRAEDMLQEETCVADCPDQLKLQGPRSAPGKQSAYEKISGG